jgi:hypothetical protein
MTALARYAAAVARGVGRLPSEGGPDEKQAVVLASKMSPADTRELVRIAESFTRRVEEDVALARVAVVVPELARELREREHEVRRDQRGRDPQGQDQTRKGWLAERLREADRRWELRLLRERQHDVLPTDAVARLADVLLAPDDDNLQGSVGKRLLRAMRPTVVASARVVNGVISALRGRPQAQGPMRTQEEVLSHAFMDPDRRDIALWCVSVAYPDLTSEELGIVATAMNDTVRKLPSD